jgi:hypothetical protein
LATAGPARGQSLTVTEASVGAAAVLAHRDFYGAELGVARRPGGQGRFAFTAGYGTEGGSPGVRLAASAQFLLQPDERTGTSLYAGFGVAFVAARSRPGAGYLTALVGLESAPARAASWYGEVGLAGGVRVAVGRRWRRLPAGRGR